jgi:hypothetical protein
MSDDLVNSVLFYFCCATLDVIFTGVVLVYGIGIEANPIWNWIYPPELMLICCILANLLFCLFVIWIIPYLKRRHIIYHIIVKFGLYGEGFGRIAFGVIPGILIMKGAGWF